MKQFFLRKLRWFPIVFSAFAIEKLVFQQRIDVPENPRIICCGEEIYFFEG